MKQQPFKVRYMYHSYHQNCFKAVIIVKLYECIFCAKKELNLKFKNKNTNNIALLNKCLLIKIIVSIFKSVQWLICSERFGTINYSVYKFKLYLRFVSPQMKNINCHNLTKFLGLTEHDSGLSSVTEFYSRGDLRVSRNVHGFSFFFFTISSSYLNNLISDVVPK